MITVNTPAPEYLADRYRTGHDWGTEDGELTVYDAEGTALARYAAGAWANVTWRPARLVKTTTTEDNQ